MNEQESASEADEKGSMLGAARAQRFVALLKKTSNDSAAWEQAAPRTLSSSVIAFLNAHALNTAGRDPTFAKALLDADRLLRDGVGVEIALKIFGLDSAANLNGTDLIPKILERRRGARIAIYGASEQALSGCRSRLEQERLGLVVSTLHGFHEAEVYLADAAKHRPDVLVLCMGMPKQELLARRLKEESAPKSLILCGGGWADFYSGMKPRAPGWVRRTKAEWIYRLSREPRRLGRRYTLDVLAFFLLVVRIRLVGAMQRPELSSPTKLHDSR